MAHFLEKPPMWWVFWWRAFADIFAQGGQVTYSASMICSWLGVSRTTLQRIVDFGTKNYASGQQVGSKWAAGKLTISVLDSSFGQQVGSKWAESDQKPAPKKKTSTGLKKVDAAERRKPTALHGKMIEVYDQWMRHTTGFPAKIDAAQGSGMKQIIQYLKKAVMAAKTTDGTEDAVNQQVLKGWGYVLANWNRLDEFYQKQTKLTQINSNLQNIVTQLRNTAKLPSDKRKEKFDNSLNEYLNNLENDAE